jgi:3,4-dihydroxy 2-butanone 4-phosphate synthase
MLVNSYTLLSNDLEGRIQSALAAMRAGVPVILLDDFDRENEADLILSAEKLTNETMAMMIRECSGIVCLCLPTDVVSAGIAAHVVRQRQPLRHAVHGLHRAREGVTTGVSAADRVTTIRAAIAPDAKPSDLVRPGHVFPCAPRPAACSSAVATPKARSTCRAWRA